MKECNYSVYVHIFPNNKRYVGITKNILSRRWGNGKNYKNQRLVYRAIEKYGWNNIEHKILYSNLTKEEATNKEIELIKEWDTTNKEYGYNSSIGGELTALGYRHTEEEKKKISDAQIGRVFSQSTKLKISEALKGNKNSLGIKRTEETKRKISVANRKKVICLDTGKIYYGIKEAVEDTGVGYKNISQCCLGKRKTAGGYKWEYKKA